MLLDTGSGPEVKRVKAAATAKAADTGFQSKKRKNSGKKKKRQNTISLAIGYNAYDKQLKMKKADMN